MQSADVCLLRRLDPGPLVDWRTYAGASSSPTLMPRHIIAA